MSYLKQFNEWNAKNKHLSVSAEQYTIIKRILFNADETKNNLEKTIDNKNKSIEKLKEILLKKIEMINELKQYLYILSGGLIIIIITYGTVVYFIIK
jgi:hypothetical protein